MLSAVSACVVPLAPEFTDPDPVPNFPPYFVRADPFFERTVLATQTFEVLVVDPNPRDRIYVRWVSDYPIYTEANSELLFENNDEGFPTDGAPIRTTLQVERRATGCFAGGVALAQLGPGAEHSLVLIVADRRFLPFGEPAPNPDYRFNAVEVEDATIPQMVGWTIAGCD